MIIFDCERLRIPYAGFHTFTDNLAASLIPEARRRGLALGLYIPEAMQGRYGPEIPYLGMNRRQKYWLFPGKDVTLWHCSNQFSRYLPTSRRIPVVTTIHDCNYLYLYEGRPLKRDYSKRHWQRAVDRADRIVTISEYARQDILRDLRLDGKTVDVIPNGHAPYEGPVVPPAVLPQRDFLFTVSRVAANKNTAVLPPLLHGNDCALIIAGRVEDRSYADKTRAVAREWGVEERVHFVGEVPESVKHWYLEHCTAFLFPSLSEGFGIPVLEAMEHYKPVFCSDRTALPEVAGPFAFYFNHAFDPAAMQEEFEKGMAAFRAGCFDRQAMQAHVEAFSWAATARRYFDVYEEMLAR